jgi:hypothetical protein
VAGLDIQLREWRPLAQLLSPDEIAIELEHAKARHHAEKGGEDAGNVDTVSAMVKRNGAITTKPPRLTRTVSLAADGMSRGTGQ